MNTGKCSWLHEILAKLPFINYPFDISELPLNAIYFFYEKGEICKAHKKKERIVRIGTARQNNFRSRISEHYLLNEKKVVFDENKPKPSDRSIFRKNIGRAILNQKGDNYLTIWNIDFTNLENRNKFSHLRKINKEQEIECEITKIIRSNFYFRFFIYENEYKRIGPQALENRLIGSVSNCQLCKPSLEWLGQFSPIPDIKISGLWQTQHLWSDEINNTDKKEIIESVNKQLYKDNSEELSLLNFFEKQE